MTNDGGGDCKRQARSSRDDHAAGMKVLWNIVVIVLGIFIVLLFAGSIAENNSEAKEKALIASMNPEELAAYNAVKEQHALNRFAHIRDLDYQMSESEKILLARTDGAMRCVRQHV